MLNVRVSKCEQIQSVNQWTGGDKIARTKIELDNWADGCSEWQSLFCATRELQIKLGKFALSQVCVSFCRLSFLSWTNICWVHFWQLSFPVLGWEAESNDHWSSNFLYQSMTLAMTTWTQKDTLNSLTYERKCVRCLSRWKLSWTHEFTATQDQLKGGQRRLQFNYFVSELFDCSTWTKAQ